MKSKQKSTTMRRTLLMIMAVALLLTQCRKPSVELPTVEPANENMVSMTITAGPGGKTDISETGGITWSTGDKLYVGDGAKYIGCLTLQGAGGSATGTFSGNVTLTGISDGTQQTFHFFYLGSNPPAVTSGASSVEVSFAEQTGLRENLGSCHVGYGSAKGTVKDGIVTGINVTLVSKVAIAYFSFKDGTTPYTDALTLSGEHIYNKMTVNFSASDFSFDVTQGDIRLSSGNGERYVMLVPSGADSDILNFGGDDGAKGTTTLANGIEANKFYGQYDAIAVSVEAPSGPQAVGWTNATSPKAFSVSSTKKVYFSQGNLQWSRTNGTGTNTTHTTAGDNSSSPYGNEGTWRFAEHQFDYIGSGNGSISPTYNGWIDLFGWATSGWKARTSGTCYYMPYETNTDCSSYGPPTSGHPNLTGTYAKSDWGVYNDISNDGSLGVGAWRTLTSDYGGEWSYLVDGRTNASTLCGKGKVENICGLIILPDDFNWASTGLSQWTKSGYSSYYADNVYTYSEWHAMETEGAVFLPAAGYRNSSTISGVGTIGYYWSVSCSGEPIKLPRTAALSMVITEDDYIYSYSRMPYEENRGHSVRLVRDAN